MSNDYAALLKNARGIPVLNTGIDTSVTSECTFPTKEHPSLLTHTGKTVNTPLNSTLSARHIKLPTNPKDPHYADRNKLLLWLLRYSSVSSASESSSVTEVTFAQRRI